MRPAVETSASSVAAFDHPVDQVARGEEERREQDQERHDAPEQLVRCVHEDDGTQQSSDHAREEEGKQEPAVRLDVAAVGDGAAQRTWPHRRGIRRIRLDRSDSERHERRKRDQTAAAGDRIDRAGEDAGNEHANHSDYVVHLDFTFDDR